MQLLKNKLAVGESLYYGNMPYFFSISNASAINKTVKSIFNLPHKQFVEHFPALNHKNYQNNNFDTRPDLSLSLTTVSCYNSDIANAITDVIISRFNIDSNQYDKIRTCLHEAIINSVLHGNLQIKNNYSNASELYNNQEIILHRLNIDLYKYKQINIYVWDSNNNLKIGIRDEGNGFELSDYIKTDDEISSSLTGRGIPIINSMVDNLSMDINQCILVMEFKHKQ